MNTDWLELGVVICGILAGVIVSTKPAIALARRGVTSANIAGISALIGLLLGAGGCVAAQWLYWWKWDSWDRRQLAKSRIVEQHDLEDRTIYELVQPASSTRNEPNARLICYHFNVEWYGVGPVGVLGAVVAGSCSLAFTRRYRKRRKLGLCMDCGYDLRGSIDRCPECGTPFERPG